MKELQNIRIGIAQNLCMVREGIAAFLADKDGIEIVFMAKSGRETIRLSEKRKPDIVLMDMQLEVMKGDVATGVIRKKFPHIKVLALTMSDNESAIHSFVRNQCNGFITKGESLNELLHAIYLLEGREFYYNKYITRATRAKILNRPSNEPPPKLIKLTKREKQVIYHIGQDQNYREIGMALHISKRTVERHAENISHKLGIRSVVGIALYGYRNGFF